MKRHLAKLMTGGAIIALALTGCGSGSPSGSTAPEGGGTAASGDLQKVTVGVLPIAPSAAMQYGIDEGIFEKHGLEVELQTGQGGAAMLPAVSTGTMNFAVGNPLSVMTAVDKGLDMKIVSGYSNSKAEGEDINGVVTKADAGIDNFADLEGKTTAVNTLKTQGDLTIMESAAIDGGDPQALKFSEMPFPDMEAQLERGNVDAVWLPEPFLSKALANEDYKLVGYPNQKALPGLPTMVTFTSGSYASENPEIVADFKAAVTEALEAAEADPEGVRAVLPEFMGMDEAVAKGLKMETFDGEVPTEVLSDMGELMLKYEYVEKAPDVAAMTVQ
ncbi:NMT1/THI5 like domain-containing protein [Arthrobacter crystallopoietes BAB-32]|uniref:NMT1/THI5 like domain-containing protein n=1 Tax=Arthrobacter crystallopoietes BAB-32 TaxID=1246476 RepID=N1V0G8_9MICC|nr:ABC transporter substrate-binding protein [Arthrobacter crystallopoietes]EMY33534.1 NMT1/THI5 like domain-containing protein [Arthrobacter crystallopoietes BAB-32]